MLSPKRWDLHFPKICLESQQMGVPLMLLEPYIANTFVHRIFGFFFGGLKIQTQASSNTFRCCLVKTYILSLYLENFTSLYSQHLCAQNFWNFFFGFQNPNTRFQQLIVMFPDVCLTFLVFHLCWRFSKFNIDKFQNFENFCT